MATLLFPRAKFRLSKRYCPFLEAQDPQYDQQAGQTLEEAQENKMRAALDKLQLEPGMEVLEIGSGWGGLAVMAAKEYGVRIKSITLPEQQLKVANQRAIDECV